ncbi:MAG: hypothetical protein M1827_000184 [Pycnora praestabilis]|nr:MAG: hypothetical protein M1827_000184 [Pycnora praestabilis]
MPEQSPMRRIPAGLGEAVSLLRGQTITISNTHGKQVLSTWAFSNADAGEFLSMEHTRMALRALNPSLDDQLVSNRRRPMLTLTRDTTPGAHDTLMAACDAYRYRQLGVEGYHNSCVDNLKRALDARGVATSTTPCAFNLFMNVQVGAKDGSLAIEPPTSEAGQFVALRAEMDLTMVFSCCPQDTGMVPGFQKKPTDVHFKIA